METPSNNDLLLQAAVACNQGLMREKEKLLLTVEQLKIDVQRKDIELKKMCSLYQELSDKHEREMACYKETVDYMYRSQHQDSVGGVSRYSTSRSQLSAADRPEQLARSLNMDLFK